MEPKEANHIPLRMKVDTISLNMGEDRSFCGRTYVMRVALELEVRRNFWKSNGSQIEVLEVEWKFQKLNGSRMEAR